MPLGTFKPPLYAVRGGVRGCLSISGSCAFIVSHVPCCGYLNVCFLCLLHFNFAVSPFLFRLFFALSSAKHCRRIFPFFRYTALLLFLLHVFHLALPLWPFYYDFVDFAFPAKNNIGEVLQVPHAKTEYSARHQSKTVHSG